MARVMKGIAAASVAFTGIFIIFYQNTQIGLLLSLAITFGTIAYHFCMRLLIGYLYSRIMKNHADYRKKWYRTCKWEQAVYKKLKVKGWKDRMPSFHEDSFNPKFHSWEEIIGAMCQAELVHETIMVFSFLPVLASIWLGEFLVFLITSVLSAGFDLLFVIMQRYNRPRIIKMIEKSR